MLPYLLFFSFKSFLDAVYRCEADPKFWRFAKQKVSDNKQIREDSRLVSSSFHRLESTHGSHETTLFLFQLFASNFAVLQNLLVEFSIYFFNWNQRFTFF